MERLVARHHPRVLKAAGAHSSARRPGDRGGRRKDCKNSTTREKNKSRVSMCPGALCTSERWLAPEKAPLHNGLGGGGGGRPPPACRAPPSVHQTAASVHGYKLKN